MCIEMPHAQEPMAKEIPTAMRKRTRRHGKAHSTFPGTLKRRVVNTTKPSLVDPLSFLPPDGRKDQKEFIGFLPQLHRRISSIRAGFHNHAHPVPGLLRLLFAGANLMHEFLPRHRFVRFAVVGAHAGPAAHKLTDQGLRHTVLLHRTAELDYPFPEQRRSLRQIKGWLVAFLTSAHVGCLGLLGHSLVMGS